MNIDGNGNRNGNRNGDDELTPAQTWWWDMSEAQKEFWYASRTKFEADRLSRRLRAGWWFLFLSLFLVTTQWLGLVLRFIEGRDVSWGLWVSVILLTLVFLWTCFLYFVTIEHITTDEEELDTKRRMRDADRGVGNAWDDPADLDLSVKTEQNLNTFDEEHGLGGNGNGGSGGNGTRDEFDTIEPPSPKRKFHWRRNSRG